MKKKELDRLLKLEKLQRHGPLMLTGNLTGRENDELEELRHKWHQENDETLRVFWFWLKRTVGAAYEKVHIVARDSSEAIANLPECVTWDFAAPHQ
jgi:hypothetical protein